ncbi:MAG: N-acetylglucosamine-6-phosphate deacetylase, partial [Actinomycetota bacterium]
VGRDVPAEPTVHLRVDEPRLDAARQVGLHLEGPAIARAHRGAHPSERLVEPTAAVVGAWTELDALRMVTLAPELPGAVAATERLVEAGVVVSIGHTGADRAQVAEVVDAGATSVTHLFNAMAPFHHRDPGVIGAVLDDDRLSVGLIGDGIHVAPEAIALAWRAAGPERIVLTTDAVAGLGTDDPVAELADGTLAGGTTPFDQVVRVVEAAIGHPPPESITAGNARKLLGLTTSR